MFVKRLQSRLLPERGVVQMKYEVCGCKSLCLYAAYADLARGRGAQLVISAAVVVNKLFFIPQRCLRMKEM